MERFVRRKNIEHYQDMLKARSDPAQRETKKLLAEEEKAVRQAEEQR